MELETDEGGIRMSAGDGLVMDVIRASCDMQSINLRHIY